MTARFKFHTWVAGAIAMLGFVIICGVMIGKMFCKTGATSMRAQMHIRLCVGTAMGMAEDAAAFASSDNELRARARTRFYHSQTIFHGSQSVEMCLGGKLPEAPRECFIDNDWACLANFATQLEQSIHAYQN